MTLDRGAFGPVEGAAQTEGQIIRTAGLLEPIKLMISCGDEVRRLRNICADVVVRVDHLLVYDLKSRFTVKQWDFHLDPAREEPAGHAADRSLETVADSELIIAILGSSVPEVTHQEIRQVYELRKLGQTRDLWVYVYRKRSRVVQTKATGVTVGDLVKEIRDDFQTDLVYHSVKTELEFQASVMTQLIPFLVRRASEAFGPIVGSGAA